jgi:thiamine phosphate synthase YjbQ (UPF0047 family)
MATGIEMGSITFGTTLDLTRWIQRVVELGTPMSHDEENDVWYAHFHSEILGPGYVSARMRAD